MTASQAALRKSIKETERLVDESDKMLRRHREECEDDDDESGGDRQLSRLSMPVTRR